MRLLKIGSICDSGISVNRLITICKTIKRRLAMKMKTALTAQNTMGVRAIMESTPAFLGQQLVQYLKIFTRTQLKLV